MTVPSRDRDTLRTTSRILPTTARKWLYNVAIAALPLAVAYGAISADLAPLYAALAAALVAVPARANLA